MLSKGRNDVEVCSGYEVKGHSHERCWTVIEYPKLHLKHKPGFKGRGGGSAYSPSSNGSNTYSYNMGRNRRFTPSRTAANMQGDNEKHETSGIAIQQLEQLLKNLLGDSSAKHEEFVIDDEFDSGFAAFVGMLTCYNVHIEKMKWIIDSGASDHMWGESNVVKNVVNLKNKLKINMPNGDTSNIIACGNVDLKNGLHLKQVLVVPEFKHNLLSVSKLAKNEQCTLNFYGG